VLSPISYNATYVIRVVREWDAHAGSTRPIGTTLQVRRIDNPLLDTQPHDAVGKDTPDEVTEELPAVLGAETTDVPRRSKRRRNVIILAAVVVLAAGAGIGIWLGTSGSPGSGLVTTTQIVTATTGTMKQTVSASGTVEPTSEANLTFGVSGKVTAVDVSVGQAVTAGQVLATVDSSALQATVDSAQATLTSAQAKLSSDESSGASTSQILSDKASVTSAQSQLTSAQTNLADASLTSTIAGTVASVDLSVGQQVSGSGGSSATASSGSGSPSGSGGTGSSPSSSTTSSGSGSSSAQIVVVSTASYKVSATVDDTQVGQVKQGDQATINLSSSSSSSGAGGFFAALFGGSNSSKNSGSSNSSSSGSSTTYYGTVSSVGLVATSSTGVASFPVTVAVTGTPNGLYAGSSATLTITVKVLSTVVEVPTGAISYSGGKAQVTAVTGGSRVTRSVTTGQVSTGETQITSGLKAGDKVVEQVVTFEGGSGGRSLLGNSSNRSSGFPSGGSFPAGGSFPRGGGFPGGNASG
jgi:multidrug efflux pump subunit AcrA (membrane-fusion protein)